MGKAEAPIRRTQVRPASQTEAGPLQPRRPHDDGGRRWRREVANGCNVRGSKGDAPQHRPLSGTRALLARRANLRSAQDGVQLHSQTSRKARDSDGGSQQAEGWPLRGYDTRRLQDRDEVVDEERGPALHPRTGNAGLRGRASSVRCLAHAPARPFGEGGGLVVLLVWNYRGRRGLLQRDGAGCGHRAVAGRLVRRFDGDLGEHPQVSERHRRPSDTKAARRNTGGHLPGAVRGDSESSGRAGLPRVRSQVARLLGT